VRCSRCSFRSAPPPWHPHGGLGVQPSFHAMSRRRADISMHDQGPTMDSFKLGFDATFSELSGREGLVRLDRLFADRLQQADGELHARLMAARATPASLDAKAEGELVVAVGPHLEDFLGELF